MTTEVAEIEGAAGPSAEKRALGSSFYLAMRIMPPAQRQAMFEIYSFCRAVDDIADDEGPVQVRLEQLDRWRSDIDAIYGGEGRPGLEALAEAVRNFNLQREDFRAIIDGMEMDVREDIQAPDFVTLDLYCDRVASAVGRLSVRVFGLPEGDGKQLAENLGRALQLTNILRDLDEDAERNRLYLPREFLADAGIASTDPRAVISSPGLDEVCGRIASLACWRFAEADKIMARFPRSKVRTPRLMSEAYKSILSALGARGWRPPRRRVSISKPRIALILLRLFIL